MCARLCVQALLWRSLTVDFGHEVVTAIHTPLKWSNQRPSSAEFETTLAATSLSASKVSAQPAVIGVRGTPAAEHTFPSAANCSDAHLPPADARPRTRPCTVWPTWCCKGMGFLGEEQRLVLSLLLTVQVLSAGKL